jgi:2-C-methyl-D-erythritol 4-phosphate cytidylyltransferase
MAVALLVAAGGGERLGADRPKAFVVLAGCPMLEWSLAALRPAVDHVVVALPEGEDAPPGTLPAPGGAWRSASVRNALAAAPPGDPVVVHDAARPLVTTELVERCLAAVEGVEGAIAAAPVSDTVKEAGGDGLVSATLDRSRLWAVQTPQVFRRDALERALAVDDEVLAQATDDAWLVERSGGRVRVVPSLPANLKVTTPSDLRVAEDVLRERC